MRHFRRGFTLIELLIVIAIVGFVATIAMIGVGSARAKSRDNKRATDLKQIQKALELSFEPGSGYPVTASAIAIGGDSTDVLCAKGSAIGFVADQSASNCDAGKVFMGLVPANPAPGGETYTYRSTDGSGNVCTAAPCLGFCIQTSLEIGLAQSGLSAGTVIADQSSIKNGSCP
jgi:prepilin-type N-terminal cleavage/methylation domain-containing protein